MDFGLALIILAEVVALLLLFYGYMHEAAVVAWEDRMIAAVRKRIKAFIRSRNKAKCTRVNASSAYTPVKPEALEASHYGVA